MWAHFCNAFLIRLSDFRHEITLEFAGPVFSRSPLLKATDAIYFRDIRPLCVGATPVPKGFYHMSNFELQFPIYKQGHTASLTHRVQRSYALGWDIRADHPDVPAVGHDALSLSKLFDDFQVILLSYA